MFPGENEQEQIQCMMEVLGPPPAALLAMSSRRKNFFDDALNPKLQANSRGTARRLGHCLSVFYRTALQLQPRQQIASTESCLLTSLGPCC